jgi:hypothetical protein
MISEHTHASPGLYLAAIAAGFATPLVLVAAFLLIARGQDRLAAPPLTGNQSFDEKVVWLREHGGLDCDVLAVGSSMTLNNLDSATLARNLPEGWRFRNAAAWGLKIKNTRAEVEFMLKHGRPKAVIVVSSYMDFLREPATAGPLDEDEVRPEKALFFKEDEVASLAQDGNYWLSVAQHFDLSFYVKNYARIKRMRTSNQKFNSCMFDAGGSVPLAPIKPEGNAFRWGKKVDLAGIDAKEYLELAALASWLQTYGVRLIFVQPPIRSAAASAETPEDLRWHWRRIDEILSAHGFRFVNFHEKLRLSDAYFADYSHLNATGAAVFSQALADEYATELGRGAVVGKQP